eukprot:SM000065S20190  [mRNA]  locus=s65:262213:263149:+ [translate_table: standard]
MAAPAGPPKIWRNRDEIFEGREATKAFLRRKWEAELDYRLTKWLFCHDGHRIAVHFQYEFHDAGGQCVQEYDDEGLMKKRDMSCNNVPITFAERRIKVDQAPILTQ